MKRSFFIALFFLLSATAFAQDSLAAAQAFQTLKEYYAHWHEQVNSLSADKACYMQYRLSTQLSAEYEGSKTTSLISIYANNSSSVFISKEVEIYQQNYLRVVVLPYQQSVTVTNTTPKEIQAVYTHSFMSLRDTLLEVLQPIAHSKDSSGISELKLAVGKNKQQKYPFEYMLYRLNTKTKQLLSVEVQYKAGKRIQHMKTEIITTEFAATFPQLNINPLDRIYVNGKANEQYAEYQIRDLRKQ